MTRVSTRLYVYAIFETPFQIDDVPGLALVRGPACWVAVKHVDATQIPQATAEALMAQDAIVRTLASRTEALLPARFGTTFENETALRARLEEIDRDRLRAALGRVRGCEQMIVRAFQSSTSSTTSTSTPVATSGGGPGTAYLTQRAAALKTAPSRLQPLRDQLASIVRDEIAEATSHAPVIESLYHLIARGTADRYQAIVSSWTPPADLVVRVSGPSPAYAFAKDALAFKDALS